MSGKYYPHNWDAIQEAPAEYFESCTFEDFALWKINGWEIPSSVSCIIRAEIGDKVKEYTYQRAKAAQNKVKHLMEDGVTFTVCDNDAIHFLKTADILDDLGLD